MKDSMPQAEQAVVTAGQEAVYRVIAEDSIVRLSAADQLRFVELLLNPPSLSPALNRAREAHEQLFGVHRRGGFISRS